MADKTVGMDVLPAGTGLPVKYIDQGDGTYALKVATTGGGGGGGGAVTVADGADATQGLIADAVITPGAAGTISAKLRTLLTQLPASLGLKATTASMSVVQASDDAQFGAEYTGYSPDTGATGVRGLLSTIAKAVRGVLSVSTVDATASASINVQNGNATGAGTAGSFVALANLNGASSLVIQVSGTWAGVIAVQGTNDGTNWFTLWVSQQTVSGVAPAAANIATGLTGAWSAVCSGISQVRATLTTYTSGTAVVTLRASQSPAINQGAAAAAAISHLSNTSIQIAANVGGNFGAILPVGLASSSTQTLYSAISVVTSAKTGLTIITDSGSIGTISSFLVNLTAFTAGSSIGIDFFVQYSPDAGTTWIDIWQTAALTAVGTIDIPPLYIPGRLRFAYQNRGGAATTATVTITATRLNAAVPVSRQFFDRTAALLSSTAAVGAAGATYDIAGCTNVTYLAVQGAATGPASYQIAVSNDNVNFALVGSPVSAVASKTTAISATGVAARYCQLQVTTAATSQAPTVFAMSAH